MSPEVVDALVATSIASIASIAIVTITAIGRVFRAPREVICPVCKESHLDAH